ncbi:hypothetical protein JCM16418_2991 [Paenibacillus pini JCM 16418]|uniref:Uncharacterized protein n=1 Tax=Paenibacillus pini JCM 16418 TaxID=1236976 RepID=W7YK45_9BACL|nr:hypothetical protein JCM16418_2991 [Paenibacillus pini JCM 16418]
MEGVEVSIDRIVVDFTNVYWTFSIPFHISGSLWLDTTMIDLFFCYLRFLRIFLI